MRTVAHRLESERHTRHLERRKREGKARAKRASYTRRNSRRRRRMP